MKRLIAMCICLLALLTACQNNEPMSTSETTITAETATATKETIMSTTSEHLSEGRSQVEPTTQRITSATVVTFLATTAASTSQTISGDWQGGLRCTLRSIPAEIPPEIEKNTALLLSVLPYLKEEADRAARRFYQAGVPEIKKVTEVIELEDENHPYALKMIGIDDVEYGAVFSARRYVGSIAKRGEDGKFVFLM